MNIIKLYTMRVKCVTVKKKKNVIATLDFTTHHVTLFNFCTSSIFFLVSNFFISPFYTIFLKPCFTFLL